MPDKGATPRMLLVEPETMLRRTVALTARSLGMAEIREAASMQQARQLLKEERYDGAVIAIDSDAAYDLSLVAQVREGGSVSRPGMPIAVMTERCTAELLGTLRQQKIDRIIVKPFRARALLDAFGALEAAAAT